MDERTGTEVNGGTFGKEYWRCRRRKMRIRKGAMWLGEKEYLRTEGKEIKSREQGTKWKGGRRRDTKINER